MEAANLGSLLAYGFRGTGVLGVFIGTYQVMCWRYTTIAAGCGDGIVGALQVIAAGYLIARIVSLLNRVLLPRK